MGKVKIQLNQEKEIRGKKFNAGTVIGEYEPAGKFNVKDFDLAMQLGQIKVGPPAESNKEDK